ncbi:endonuclease domain-containing protein [Spirosoma spitsbergense]|uniref:endonuclease domain-containing protein n=1 Tax=Spirosoma spitsbergense TaxID=431554 RepID=UPI0003786F95|nr:endonuclease domain-containing protein [Spirosoma spitsbergense]
MRSGQLNNLNVLTPIRKELRNGATEAEVTLWHHLKGRQLAGRKFRRQHSIGLFVLDFYCPSDRLAIEVDGDVHNTPDAITHDEERQHAIETLNITVLRFRNDDVLHRIDQVLSRIHEYLGTADNPG